MKNYKRGDRRHLRQMKIKRVQRLIWWMRQDYGLEPWWVDFLLKYRGPEAAAYHIRRQQSVASRYVDNMAMHKENDWYENTRPRRVYAKLHLEEAMREFEGRSLKREY